MKNDTPEQIIFKDKLRAWIRKQIKQGKFQTAPEVWEHLAKQLGTHPREGKIKPYTVATIKMYLHGPIFPVNWKHVDAIHKATKIPKKVLNPDIFK